MLRGPWVRAEVCTSRDNCVSKGGQIAATARWHKRGSLLKRAHVASYRVVARNCNPLLPRQIVATHIYGAILPLQAHLDRAAQAQVCSAVHRVRISQMG